MTVITSKLGNLLHRVTGNDSDYDALLERIGNSSLVLIGEASHGTHEFYRERANITRRLIQEKGFNVVAVTNKGARIRLNAASIPCKE